MVGRVKRYGRVGVFAGLAAFALITSPTGSAQQTPGAAAPGLRCDESLKTEFRPDDHTTVLQVRLFRRGEPFPNQTMEQMVFPDQPATFGADLCMVKLLVGPGNPGPSDAPSTSIGIGIEVWLPQPEVWNHRIHAIGGSGTANGTEETVLDRISSWTGAGGDTRSAPHVAADEGAVVSTTDSGQQVRSAAFMMSPDGTINARGLNDWTYRSLYEQAVKTRALATAYYGSAPRYAYFDGASGGGRQANHVAQNLPEQYDGIVSRVPADNWNEIIAQIYPLIVTLRDLGGNPLSRQQLDLVSNAAIASCDMVGGRHLGFILDNRHCRYDPTKDRAVLCTPDGGSNRTPACVTRVQALAVSKFWYGLTSDGSVPDPAIDNGWDAPPAGVRRWYGIPRGTTLAAYANLNGGLSAEMIAVAMGDPSLAPEGFRNGRGSGQEGWRNLSYEQLAAAFDRGQALQQQYGISANNPDLTRLERHGTRYLSLTAYNDEALFPQGDIQYLNRVFARMGGVTRVQQFYRHYFMPGHGHGQWNGTSNPAANPPVPARQQLYSLLVDWVENGNAPSRVIFTSSALNGTSSPFAPHPAVRTPEISLPGCPYPLAPTYVRGDIHRASSYVCG